MKSCRRADHVGDYVNRATACCGNRMAAIVGGTRRARRRIVVLKVIDYVHVCRGIAQEFQKLAMLGGTEFPGQSQGVADSLNSCASCKSLFGDSFFDAAFVLRRFGSERVVRFFGGGFLWRRIYGFRISACL